MKIHVDWTTGVPLKEAYELTHPTDYGIYQIYGSHPIYGHNVLLYIGKARDQTFGVRLRQHIKWINNQDSSNVRVYTGRIASGDSQDEHWDLKIDHAEKLLIYTHQPACNSSNINTLGEIPEDTHVYNWVDRGMLLPEVSAYRYMVADEEFTDFDILSAE